MTGQIYTDCGKPGCPLWTPHLHGQPITVTWHEGLGTTR